MPDPTLAADQAERWRRYLAEGLSLRGVEAEPTIRPSGRKKASQRLGEDLKPSPIADILTADLAIACPARTQAELGPLIDAAERAAQVDGRKFGAAITFRRGRRGWDVEVIREEGKSAKSIRGRDALIGALDRLDKRQADVLLAVRLDRVSRSVVDFAGLMNRAERRGWGIVLLTTGIDTTAAADPGSRFTAHIHAAAAEHERGLISMRTREGMAQRRAEGATFGRAVRDYFRPTYARVLKMHADGMSLNKIAATLDSEGVLTAKQAEAVERGLPVPHALWHASTVRAIITSETAKGLGIKPGA